MSRKIRSTPDFSSAVSPDSRPTDHRSAIVPAHGHVGRIQSRDRSQRARVLLVEPDSQASELYADLIREVALCTVDVVREIDRGYEWIDHLDYQLVIIDVSAAQKDSFGGRSDPLWLLERIKQVDAGPGVIVITENATVEEAVAAMRLGAEDYLKKPFNPEGFKLAIKRVLDRRLVFAEQSAAANYLNLLNACQMISASLDQGKVLRILQGFLARELGSKHTAVYRLVDQRPVRVESESSTGFRDHAMEEMLDIAVVANNPFQSLIDSNGHYRFFDRAQLSPAMFVFHFKFIGGEDCFCVCLAPQVPESIEVFESKLRPLRMQLDVTGKNIKQYIGARELAYVDDATGLYNTRFLNFILDREIESSKASGLSFAVLFIDADRFKAINDRYGHLIGTKLLNALGAHVKSYVRDSDSVFRYGGDEFVAVLSACDVETAKSVAERIRRSVEESSFLENEDLDVRFTVSIGVALFPEHADSKQSVIEMADHAMYGAKKQSRNSVIVASPRQAEQEVVKGAGKKAGK